jgi:hypothetical protein
VARKYHWPNADTYVAPPAGALASAWSAQVAGRYELANNQMVAFVNEGGRLFVLVGGRPDEEFVPVDADHIVSAERKSRFGVVRDASGAVTGLSLSQGTTTRAVPRIGPLFRDVAPPRNDDSALDARVDAALRAIATGGSALDSVSGITDGLRRDFGAHGWPPAAGLRSLQFVGVQDVEGRNIERHDSKVARVAYYRMDTSRSAVLLLVYLTTDGLVTDLDDVDG